MKRVCTICARGGSKGLPGKNLLMLLGKPLISHTIDQAIKSDLFNNIAVSSDSDNILEVARRSGATHLVKRPDHLASDMSAKVPAIAHCLSSVEAAVGFKYDIVVDLDATSPLRAIGDIAGVVKVLEDTGASNVITAAPARRSPYFNLVELNEAGEVRLSKGVEGAVVRRQDAPLSFDMNASIYAWQRDVFMEAPAVFYNDTRLFVMPEERSHDIDSEQDFEWVKFLMERRNGR